MRNKKVNEVFAPNPNGDGETVFFEGNEAEARRQFEAEVEGTDDPSIDANFEIFCERNLTKVKPKTVKKAKKDEKPITTGAMSNTNGYSKMSGEVRKSCDIKPVKTKRNRKVFTGAITNSVGFSGMSGTVRRSCDI